MTLEEVYNSINKGAPCFLDIELDLDTIKEQCTEDKHTFQEKLIQMKAKLRKQLISLNSKTKLKYNNYFLKKIIVSPNFNDSISSFKYSQMDYLRKLKDILEVDDESLDYNNQQLHNKLLKKVDELKSIKTEEELQEKFPEIYKDFAIAKEKNREFRYKKAIAIQNQETDMISQIDRQWSLYNDYALSPEINNFIPRQANMYRNMVIKKNLQSEYCRKTPLDNNLFTDLNKDKFELYIASKYLEKAKISETIEDKQKCLFYLIPYLIESVYKKVEIKDENKKKVTVEKIYKECKKLMKDNPELVRFIEERDYYKGRNHKYSKNSINKHLPGKANWEFLPEGEKLAVVHPGLSKNKKSTAELQEELEKAKEQFIRKQRFYNESKYVYRLSGSGDFAGYVAHVYDNGETILDKFYEDRLNIKPAKDVAIYNIKAVDFIALSKLPKATLIKDKRVDRLYHTDNWEDRAQEIIDKPITKESKQEVEELGNKLKIKVYKEKR